MTTNTITVVLSPHEGNYLYNADFLRSYQIDMLRDAESPNDQGAVLRLSRDSAEEFREAFTDQLAKFGFDENYDPTPEERILEDLIDRFYVA